MAALVLSMVCSFSWSHMQLYGSLKSVANDPRLRQL
jgi:hypothetical protein